MRKNPYEVLGVQKDASANDIKKAYFQLAKKYHPDTNKDPASKERFLEIQTAYETLSDESKRKAYDTYGEASQQPGFGENPFAGAQNPFTGGPFDFGGAHGGAGRTMGDMLNDFFGMSGRRGDDLETSVTISFMEAARGTVKTVNISAVEDCGTCSGSGLKQGTRRSQCPRCKGTGQQAFVLNSGFQMRSACPACNGSGSTIPRGSECRDCGGVGKVKHRKQVEVNVPAGIEDGMTIRVAGEGDAAMSQGGRPGDLLVRINVTSSPHFRRQGAHLYHDVSIPLQTAVLGGQVRVPTLDGDIHLRVAPGTQPGDDVVLRGRGMPAVMERGKGDLFVSFRVQIPRSLTARQRELFQQYADDVEGKSTKSSEQTTGSGSSKTTSASSSPSRGADGGSTRQERSGATPKENDDGSGSSKKGNDDGGGILSNAWTRLKDILGLQ